MRIIRTHDTVLVSLTHSINFLYCHQHHVASSITVNIQASPLVNKELINDNTIKDNVDTDVGDRDLTSLYASTYDNHPATVSTNLDTVVMQPLDPIIDTFLDDDSAQIAFSTTPVDTSVPPPFSTPNPSRSPAPSQTPVTPFPTMPTTLAPVAAPIVPPAQAIDTSLMLMKPDPTLVDNMTDVLLTSTYDPTTGFNNSGIGGNGGALGTQGVLSYYYGAVDPGSAQVLDQCSVGSVNGADCAGTDASGVAAAQLSECGQPWTCPDLSGLSATEKAKCESFERFWFETRKDFEENCWIDGPASSQDGTQDPDVYLGFCNSTGPLAYNRLIADLPAPFSCDPDTQTNSAYNVIAWGNGRFQNQKLSLTTGEFTGQTEACVSGSIAKAGFEPPYNILMVIDVSGSTRAAFAGTPPGDVNGDGQYDTILDAEIGSMIAVLEHIAGSASLGNFNVNIGVVTFSTYADYVGQFEPSDPTDETKVNPDLLSVLTGLRSGGYTHFDDALDKSIEFYQQAPPDRSNLMFFLSDGIPNVSGDGDNEEQVSPSNNHISALTYSSELAILDQLNVARLAVGVGGGSDVRGGFGLDMIDNTPDEETGVTAQQVTTTDELTEVLLSNPVVGQVTSFELKVNGQVVPSLDVSVVVPGPTGFVFGELVITGLDPTQGVINRIMVTVTVDYDGDTGTGGDSHQISVENVVIGNLQ